MSFKMKFAIVVGNCGIGIVGDIDIPVHPVMAVTFDFDEPRFCHGLRDGHAFSREVDVVHRLPIPVRMDIVRYRIIVSLR